MADRKSDYRQVGQFQVQKSTAQIDNPQMGGKMQMITSAVYQVNVLVSVGGSQQDAGRIRSILDQILGTPKGVQT